LRAAATSDSLVLAALAADTYAIEPSIFNAKWSPCDLSRNPIFFLEHWRSARC